jgi:hypothetical protein
MIRLTPESTKTILNTAVDKFTAKGADFFIREKNRIIYENRLLKFVSNWNLMITTDGGALEVNTTDNLSTELIYSVKLIRPWIFGLLMSIIVLLSTKEASTAAIVFGIYILLWLTLILRHNFLLSSICKEFSS